MTHYYSTDGSPQYEITGKNGKKRTPYIKEAKELGLAPGATSILGQLNKPALLQWMRDRVMNTCADNPFCEMGTSLEDWKVRIKRELAQDNERITGQGHKIHDALEQYFKTGVLNKQYEDFIVPVIKLMESKWPHIERTDWIAEQSFCYKGLYGGKVDIHYPGGDKGLPIILDFKTKDTEDVKKFKAYEEHKQQLISYGYGLEIPGAYCGNIFLSALRPGIVEREMHDREELQVSWQKFKLLVKYWHLENYKQEVLI